MTEISGENPGVVGGDKPEHGFDSLIEEVRRPTGAGKEEIDAALRDAEATTVRHPTPLGRGFTLFMRGDEVEAAWAWADSLLDAWAERREAPRPYPAGTWGPTDAIALVARDGRAWHEGEA